MEPPLDRSMFHKLLNCLSITIDKSKVNSVHKLLGRNRLFHFNKMRNVLTNEVDTSTKIILLDPKIKEMNSELTELLKELVPFKVEEKEIEIQYEQLSADDILKMLLLPHNIEAPSSFETIGHIAHLNLRPEHEPYKKRIAQVILDKTPNLKTVVNKTGIIETQFRTFPMEVLAGLNELKVDLRMNGHRFKFDFSKVYWNSRLSEEHEKLVKERFKSEEILLDAFCGVGPFAIRAAKIQMPIYANDLNPSSVESLIESAELNHLQITDCRDNNKQQSIPLPMNGLIRVYNMDAREFLRKTLEALGPLKIVTHVVMNLPATAPEFLDSLIHSLPVGSQLPNIHCYCFATALTEEEREKQVILRIQKILSSPNLQIEVRHVRDVAPNKHMICAHFTLPSDIGYIKSHHQKTNDDVKNEKDDKRMKPM